MKALIIGYGSIGKRHHEVLSQIETITSIAIVTSQILRNHITFQTLEEIDELEYFDYFIIASETHKHFKYLSYLEEKLKNKIIFCEKPLFETNRMLSITNNTVCVGYVLRFHPLMQLLQKALQGEHIVNASIECGQYLPRWRENGRYQDSYSASQARGGGVLLDLSHEIDYAQWLFGTVKTCFSFQEKISDLEIDSDDFVTIIAKTDQNVRLTLTLDYISKITHRKMLINTISATYIIDFIANSLHIETKEGEHNVHIVPKLERNSLFNAMHQSVLATKENVCTYAEAQGVMKTISMIQGQNHG